MRAVTRVAIREARLKEIKQEMLNSQKLKVIFVSPKTNKSEISVFFLLGWSAA